MVERNVWTLAGCRVVLVNDAGHVIGQDHHRARLSDSAVDSIRDLHDEGFSYKEIAMRVGCCKSTVADICKFRRRAQTAMGQKRLAEQRVRHGARRLHEKRESKV